MLRTIFVLSFLLLAATANAQSSNYNYLQGSFGQVDLDVPGFDVDGDGLGVAASFEIDENFYVSGEYQTADVDFGVDVNILDVVGGYRTGVGRNLDLYANLGYTKVKIEGAGGGSSDDGGFSVGMGLRGAVSEAVELYGGLDYIDFDDSDSEIRAKAGFIMMLNETLGVGLKASLWDDFSVYQINVRLYFE